MLCVNSVNELHSDKSINLYPIQEDFKEHSFNTDVPKKKIYGYNGLKINSVFLSLIFLLVLKGVVWGQTTQNMYWNFNQSTTNCVANVLTKSPINANITGSYSLTNGCSSTVTGTSTGTNAFVSVTSAGNAIRNSINNSSGSKDFTFNISGSDLLKLSLFKIYFQFRRSNLASSPQLRVSYSTNGTSYTNFADLFPAYPTPNTWQEYVVDLSGVTALNTNTLSGIWFRITYSQTGTATIVDIDNFQVQSTMISTPPSCVNPTSPTNNAANVAVSSSLNWSSSAGATGYRIYLGTDASATNILNGVDLGNVTSYTPSSNLSFLTNYYWRIVPYNSYGAAIGCSIWSFTTESTNYCISNGNMSFADGITFVLFNSINNSSGKPAGYNDYTLQSTNVNIGQTYNLTVNLNTDGDYTNYATAWIDWNQNGDFTDSGESFNLGITTNNANGPTSLSPLPIQIPINANLGYTRMRVSTRFAQQPLSCDTNFDGEVEDYTINIVSACTNGILTLNTSNSTQSVCADNSISSIEYLVGGDATGASVTGLPAGVSGSYNSTSHVFTISGTPTESGTFNFTVTTSGTPVSCSEATANGTLTVNPISAPPTVTGGSICIGSIATLTASGATGLESYVWYDAASGGTPLKTSSGSTDNTFDTPMLNATTNYWVAILNTLNCESTRTQVTATFPAVSPYDQTISGNDSWIGHVYDGTTFNIYYGTYTEPETFLQVFGSNTFCFGINSNLDNRSIYTETFSVRFRMTTSLSGCYLVNLRADDGIRLFVDGTKIFDRWVTQAPTNYNNVLLPLTTNSQLVYEYYENGGQNEVAFQNLYKIENNVLTGGTNQTFCAGSPAVQISAANLTANNVALPTGITTTWQWYYSNSPTNTGTIISGATSQNYTPSGSPFNTPGTYYVYRVATVSSSNAADENNWGATNPVSCSFESDRATIVINPLPTAAVSTINSSICAEEDAVFNLTGTNNAVVTYKINGGADLTITLSGVGSANVTISNATSNQTLTLVSVSDGTCSEILGDNSTITVNPLPSTGEIIPD